MASIRHPSILELLLAAGAQYHLSWSGSEATPGPFGLVPGTAHENAEHAGLADAAALLQQHEASLEESDPPRRDVFELERDTLTRVFAATLLAKQAQLDSSKAAERARWLQEMISSAFADPSASASLSKRFARHGDKGLDADVWSAVAQADADALAGHPHFRKISSEVSEDLPGLAEQLASWCALKPYDDSKLMKK